ncbi:MAG TPA: hypothetical protein VK911_12160 [Vicinamibacterales bacterium]|nr:hypothetical protein [Vicinamibacterales bacterium]
MAATETGRYTIGVFKDVASAERGIEALKRQGFPEEALSLVAKDAPDVTALVQKVFGRAPGKIEVRGIGNAVAMGSLPEVLDEPTGDLGKSGLALAFKRVGFQTHDGRIFETLTERGGVLVAVRTEPRAADALSTLHCYGGANAAIGAWTGRL